MEGYSGGEEKNLLEEENKVKRKMKSPSQLEILEKAYAAELYPSEALRAESSVKLGLYDRQLQMWFCHQRVKDRKASPMVNKVAAASLASMRENATQKSQKVFVHVQSEIAAHEVEEIGVEHLLRDVKDTTINTLATEVLLTGFKSLPALFADTPNAVQELTIARDIYEHAVVLSVKIEDQDAFERDFFQLNPYYTDTRNRLPQPPQEYPILGLNLLRLLVQNRIAEFHTELELLSSTALENPCIKHAVELEKSFMEGAYNRVLSARQTVPHETYVYFMDLLAKTIRDEIAGCSEKAYDYVSINDAKQMLLFSKDQELLEYIIEVFCAQRGHQMLVYEYMNRGSLDRNLFGSAGHPVLEWQERLDVALGTARRLAYLHSRCEKKIIHCDIKPENILLHDQFQAKISDFKLSKLLSPEQSGLFTTMRGTRGYLAPEWLTNSAISEKADVYSYKMVLLELISGRKNCSFRSKTHSMDDEHNNSSGNNGNSSNSSTMELVYFPLFTLEMHEQKSYMDLVDPRLEGRVTFDEVEKLVRIALCCVNEDPALRPNMVTVVGMLEGGTPLPQPRMECLNFLRFYGRRFSEAFVVAEENEHGHVRVQQPRDSTGLVSGFSYISSQQISGPR